MKRFINLVDPELRPDAHLIAELNERSVSLQANEHSKFLYPGQLQGNLFFVKEGIVRSYMVREEVEFTDWFFAPGDIAFNYNSLFYNRPSEVWLEAACPAEVIQLSKEDCDFLSGKYRFFRELLHGLISDFHRRKQEHQYLLGSVKANERYKAFSYQYAYTNLRAQRKHVASFLGIRADSLSRLRRDYSS